jgi:hypothetical protein
LLEHKRAGNQLALAQRVSNLRLATTLDDLQAFLFDELQVGSSFLGFQRVSVFSPGFGRGLLAPSQIAMINRCHEERSYNRP